MTKNHLCHVYNICCRCAVRHKGERKENMADVPTYVSTAVFGLTAAMLFINVLAQIIYVIKSLKKERSNKKRFVYPETEKL